MTRCALLTLAGLACVMSAYAQVFQNQAPALGIQAINNNNLHGAGISTVDFDLDGDHDLTICLDHQIKTYRNDNGAATLIDLGFEVDDNAKHAVWIDYDNDGDLDMYFTQMLESNKLYRNDNGSFVDVTLLSGLPIEQAPTFGCAWGDYDNDGDLDLFECNYIYVLLDEDPYIFSNHLYRNNGDGSFTDVTLEAGVSDGLSLSFQSLWSDLDNDGWLDLYVINDLEHPNRLYHNNGDGTFSEIAAEVGADVAMMDAMTVSPGDFNNDGAVDLFITNTSIGECALLKNNGAGSFENIASQANVTLSMLTWGAAWFDYDLDRDLDIYVCENNYLSPQLPNPLLKNNGNEFFTNVAANTFLFDYTDSYSAAVCDWNLDGAPDMAVNNFHPQNAGLWLHSGSGNRWATVRLEGQVSNRFGVGARVDLWSDGVPQSRRMYCGQNYLAQHPYELHFGLATSTIIDSLRISWPSGHVDTFYGLPVNQRFGIEEGSSITLEINASSTIVCAGDTVNLFAASGYTHYEWSNGSGESSIQVAEAGMVSLQVTDSLGLEFTAELLINEGQEALVLFESTDVMCSGGNDGAIQIYADPSIGSVVWADGNQGFEVFGLMAGSYTGLVTSIDGCESTVDIEVLEPDPIEAALDPEDIHCFGDNNGSLQYTITGGVEPYTIDLGGWSPFALPEGTHVLHVVDGHDCEASFSFEIHEPEALVFTLEELWCDNGELFIQGSTSGGTPPYTWQWSSGETTEDLSGEVEDDIYVTVMDSNECMFQSEVFSCAVNVEKVQEDAPVVYPNPAREVLHLLWSEQQMNWSIFDMYGRHVQSGNGRRVDLAGLSAGSYVIVINETYVTRFDKF